MPLKGIHSDVRARQPNISDTVNGSDLFLRKNKDRLAPKQNDDLTKKSGDLRGEYDDIYNRSDDWLREAVDKLNNMEMDEVQRVRSFLITITIFDILIVHISPMKVLKALQSLSEPISLRPHSNQGNMCTLLELQWISSKTRIVFIKRNKLLCLP